jgi:hypothetical protein
MFMKKLLWMSLACFVFMACATTENKFVFDGASLDDNGAKIMPSASIGIIGFNGKNVHWYPGFWSGTEVIIPSGEAKLVLTLLNVQQGSVIYSGGAFAASYEFEKGHDYFIMLGTIKSKTEVDFIIRDKTTNSKKNVTGIQIESS